MRFHLYHFLSGLFIQRAAAQFQTPPASDPPPANKIDSGLDFMRYSVKTIGWECDFPSWRLWVYPNDGGTFRTQYIDRGEGGRSGNQSYTYNWTVDTTFDFKQWSFYFKIQNEENEKKELESQLFTITEPKNGSTTGAASTVTVTFTPSPESGKSGSESGGLSKGAKVGLCVGVTVGALVASGMGFLLGRWRRKGDGKAQTIGIDGGMFKESKPKGLAPQDLSSLCPKWQTWTSPRRTSFQKPVFEVTGVPMFPEQAELRGDERRERHELPERMYPRFRGVEYGVR